MALLRGGRSRNEANIWPGFVDALATVLLAMIFLLSVFVLAQFFLSQAISGRDEELMRLSEEIATLQSILSSERRANEDLRRNVSQLSAALSSSTAERDELALQIATLRERAEQAEGELERLQNFTEADRAELEAQLAELRAREAALARLRDESETSRAEAEQSLQELQTLYFQSQDRVAELEEQQVEAETRIANLQGDLEDTTARLQATLDELEGREEELDTAREARERTASELTEEQRISEAARRQVHLLNLQIADLRKQLNDIQALLDEYEARDEASQAQIADLGRRLNKALASQVEKLARYRSEFFGRLREVLSNQQGIRIVGDRFVFQSEVLFETGSADLGVAGQIQLTKLADTLKNVMDRIPDDINWVLRIDGHTDARPISTPRFPSNWELSAARAIAVAKFLTEQGIPPDRLAPTGFAAFHPIEPGDSELSMRRNRRIELKLTQR
ncbi:peptidoglycan -binding protein [Minwuia thermotolerans]|uniref:Chemotaxis protein n=1 Tax=Minwuia thermotolerans TaxID=2056226 RepID=A0A2M9FZH7_9PROT|nr:peptidoglycan -binding protein [Minwuia thermotolerans]PJK28872.1 chemotaxis protein [Minwuia thermotolerans]